ncbi:alpha/beta fold hydrolase [Methylobacterium oryzisoli]|uniref:alpha/beta fold hydrolase n=1 Tax=Methylobacterium oryzisoli TaxID=3385502 RepID=UPI003891805D
MTLDAVTVAGLRTVLRRSGPARDEAAFVFVHGNPGSSEDWTALLGAVGRVGRAVAFDMPGFGRSDKPDDFPYTVEGYARHLAGLLDHLGIARAHLVLHDFGGPWGLAWAAAHPERWASAILINTGVLTGYRWHYMARIWRTPLLGELFMATTTRAGFRLLLKHGNKRGLPGAFVERMFDEFDRDTRRAVLRLYRATDPAAGAGPLAAGLRTHPRPVRVIWGARDPYLPLRFAHQQREVFSGADIHVLDKSGHFPFADDPDRVEALVMEFAARVTRPA